MSVDIASLAIRIDSLEAREATRNLNQLGNAGRGAESATDSLTDAFKRFAGPAAAVAAVLATLKKTLEMQRLFDTLNASLITATGSTEGAAHAFKALQQFAATTPYGLQDVTKAFIQMRNLGLDPSERALNSYGNTASAMGKSLNQMVEAVADAATGEFERLKEFGVKAKQNGDLVSLTFQGVSTSIGNNAADIEKYLIGLGETKFGGGMELQANTLNGAISNLGDTWDSVFLSVSNSGIGDAMMSGVLAVSGALTDLIAILDAMSGAVDNNGKKVEEATLLHQSLTTIFETVAVLGINVAYTLRAIGTELGGLAAQAAAVASMDFAGAKAIGAMMRADGEAARRDVDARTAAILGAADKSRKFEADLAAFKKSNGYDALSQYKTVQTEAEKAAQAGDKFAKIAIQNQSRQVKMAKEIAEVEKLGLEAGKSRADIEKVIADIRAKGSSGGGVARTGAPQKTQQERDYESAVNGANRYIESLRIETVQMGLNADQVMMMSAAREAAAAPTGALSMQIMQEALALDIATKALIAKNEEEKRIAGGVRQNGRIDADAKGIITGLLPQAAQDDMEHADRMAKLAMWHDQVYTNEVAANQAMEAEVARHEQHKRDIREQTTLAMVGLAQDSASQLYGVMKQAGMDQTALGKIAFLASKGLAIAQIILNTNVAASAALAMPPLGLGPVAGIPLAGLIKGMGYASAGMVAGLAIAEVSAEGGYDIPRGVNPIVQAHEEEMILPKAQADVIRGMAANDSGGGKGGITLAPVYNIRIDGTTDQARNQQQIRAAVQQGNAELVDKLQRAGAI